jgi:hypothetical protein
MRVGAQNRSMGGQYPDSIPPSRNDRVYQDLVSAHERYLREVHASVQVNLRGKAIGHWLPYALFVHSLQLGRGVQVLVATGYADEAMPLTRAMLSATMSLLFIATSGDANGWALRYWIQMGEMEHRFLHKELRRMRFSEAVVRALMDEAQRNVDGAITQAKAEGVHLPPKIATPDRNQPRKDTWTGLSDRALAERVGLVEAYETEYDYASAISHVQAIALKPIANALMEGRPLGTGPQYGPPLPAIGASYNASSAALLGIARHFGLTDKMPQIDLITQQMRNAIGRWREDSGANAQIKLIFGERTAPSERAT